jgi:hypothetical protein
MSSSLIEKYISLLDNSFTNAENNSSKISQEIIDMYGMSGTKTRHFYNNLLNTDDARYLEIGTYKGSSVCSAMYSNNAHVICIDDWSENWGHSNIKEDFLDNFSKYKGNNDANFIQGNCFEINISELSKFNIYMYDGNHSEENQYNALAYYYNCLDDVFIYIVDDWNEDQIQSGTKRAIKDLNLTIVHEKEVFTKYGDEKGWWSGMYAVLLKKQTE